MTTLAAPTGNEIQNTLAASYTRGTDTTITLTDGGSFPNSAHVIRISSVLKWCLVIYTSKSTHVLTMGGGATDYALAKNVTVGDEAYEFPIGSIVELVCAADEVAQEMNSAIHRDVGGEIVAVAEKTAVIGADEILIEDSESTNAKKSAKISNLITALLAAPLPENTSIRLDPVLSADTKWSGITRDGTAGTTGLVYGYCYYLAVATGKWEKTDATGVATSIGEVGICVIAAAADATGTLLMYGMIRADDEFPTFTVGAPVFLSAATAGLLSSTAPTGTTDFVVRPIGSAPTADSLFFKGGDAYTTLV